MGNFSNAFPTKVLFLPQLGVVEEVLPLHLIPFDFAGNLEPHRPIACILRSYPRLITPSLVGTRVVYSTNHATLQEQEEDHFYLVVLLLRTHTNYYKDGDLSQLSADKMSVLYDGKGQVMEHEHTWAPRVNISLPRATMVLNSEDDDSRTIIASQKQQEVTQMKVFLAEGTEKELKNDEVSASLTSTSRYGNVRDYRSVNDSGYGLSEQSIATKESDMDRERADIHPLIRAGSLPLQCHSNLFHFIKPLDEATENRFKDAIPVIEELLHPVILSLPKPRLVTIRRMFLGTDEADIAAYIVILCNENHCQRIENSISTPLVRDLCESPGFPLLKVLVTDPAPRPHLGRSNIEVCRNRATTLCGTPILLVNKSEEAHYDDTRKATVSGIIKITTEDGKSKLYGMTAGHVLDDWQNAYTDMEGSNGTDTHQEVSIQKLAEYKDPPPSQSALESQHVLSEAWNFAECDVFAEILDSRKLAGLAHRDIQPSHDWALFTIKSSRPNELCALNSSGHFERRELKEAARPTFHDQLSDPVIMMGGSHGPKRGELSSLMGRILIGSSDKFVDAYMLILNEQGVIRDGDSGSWVVHNASPLVFGHVVATDVFGGIYVIPSIDTFDDIKRCLGAVSVELPTDKDFKDLETVEPLSILPCPGKCDNNSAKRRSRDVVTSQSTHNRLMSDITRVPCESIGKIQLNDERRYAIPAAEENLGKADRCVGEIPWDGIRCNPFLTLVTCEWNPKFATRREELDYGIENKAYVEARAELRVEVNVETRREPDEDERLVRAFMRARHESDICADKVEAFCFGANLESLRAGNGKGSEAVVAWLDERSFVAGKGLARTKTGPLTASGLYRELKKPRYRFGGPNIPGLRPCGGSNATRNSNKVNPDPPNPNEGQLPEEPDAERRLIFITDLDRWSIYALIGTASNYQAFALRDALYKHLAFENFIGVTFPPVGLAMFQLAFHLPYYAWRTSQKACEDHRRDANASPLRQFLDVTFLNSKSSGHSSFLYEAQISCVISGSDESRWVGYCFVDTYFEVEEVKETVQSYHEDSLADEGMLTDPFTLGERNANDPIQKPREYFLEVFRVRIDQVKCEWEQVVAKMQESIRQYIPTHHYSLALSRERNSSEVSEDHDEKVRKSRDWVVQVRRLSKQLSQDLSETVDACERFCRKYAVYFQNLPGSPDDHVHLSLAATQTTFDKLELLNRTLETLAERCDDFARDLELQLIVENIDVGNRQHKVSRDSKGLSVIMMIYISPIFLAAVILSMDKDVIPFIPARFGSFIGLVFTFSILGIIIYFAQGHRAWLSQVATGLVGQKRWDGKISGSYLKMIQFSGNSFWTRRKKRIQGDV